jgi:hypothetical protein
MGGIPRYRMLVLVEIDRLHAREYRLLNGVRNFTDPVVLVY